VKLKAKLLHNKRAWGARMLLDELPYPGVERSPVLYEVDQAGETVRDTYHCGDGQQKHKRALEAELLAARAAIAQLDFLGLRMALGDGVWNCWGGQPGWQRSSARHDHHPGWLFK
jgi:hypothetical protein